MHSDGKQARVAVMEVGDKVQVVINGARGLSRRLLNPSKIYTFRWHASKGNGTRNKISCSTGGERHRPNQVFVIS